MRTLDTPHTRLGALYLCLCILAVLCLWAAGRQPLEIIVAVSGGALLLLIWIASGLHFGDVEGA